MSNQADLAPRRFFPPRGRKLSTANVRGPWRPSGTVASAGVFAVVWSTPTGFTFWAPLHDFDQSSQLRLIEQCRWLDRYAGFPGAWPEGRAE